MLGSLRLVAGPSTIRLQATRQLATSAKQLYAARSSFTKPGPPPLPAQEQAEFDALLKANASIGATPAATAPSEDLLQHPDVRRGPKKDFEGDVNPQTGEQGGPKTDPFKAGNNDWQYGGRVTDF
ncbi:hypothetical protein DB88DRAFT_490215 [Papiliotrema laurentii]|uniref:Succinate dehydrogenase assembly factor 4, mitochondrial n=1 Tax=Papiliotrema laurentii TaxID=5418 RepID=A0AAD9FQA6_PAPLA|nr:hypothetical protein DB88DRAFT_490215 [Papiliotrema laurentii]